MTLLIRCMAALALLFASPALAQLQAGAGRAEIALTPDMLPLDGFTAILDPLQVRVVVLSQGATRIAIAVIDQTSIGADTVAEFKSLVAAATGVDPANIWIVASHTFSAPHLFSGRGVAESGAARYRSAIEAALRQAANTALNTLRPARLGYAEGTSTVSVNRNLPMAEGWWLGANEAGPTDHLLAMVRIEDLERRPIALLLNYAVQSSVMDQTGGSGSGKGVTADLGGAAARHVEQMLGQGVALYLTGAAGDQMPGLTAVRNVYDRDGRFTRQDIGAAGFPLVALQGERLGAEALRRIAVPLVPQAAPRLLVWNGTITLPAQNRPRDLGQIRPTQSYTYPVEGTAAARYSLIRIGDTVLVGVQVELNAATGLAIKRRSPFANTIVVTMVNGAAKYLPDVVGYRDITYQAMNSSYAPGSAELLANQIVADLRRLQRQ